MEKEFKCKICGYESDEPIDFMKAVHQKDSMWHMGFTCNDCAEDKLAGDDLI